MEAKRDRWNFMSDRIEAKHYEKAKADVLKDILKDKI